MELKVEPYLHWGLFFYTILYIARLNLTDSNGEEPVWVGGMVAIKQTN